MNSLNNANWDWYSHIEDKGFPYFAFFEGERRCEYIYAGDWNEANEIINLLFCDWSNYKIKRWDGRTAYLIKKNK